MVGVVTVMGASGAHVPVTVNGGVAFSLAQAYASAVNGLGSALFSQNLTPGIAPATVPGSKVGEGVVTVTGTYNFPTGYSYLTNAATGGVVINESAITTATSVLASTGGTTLMGGA